VACSSAQVDVVTTECTCEDTRLGGGTCSTVCSHWCTEECGDEPTGLTAATVVDVRVTLSATDSSRRAAEDDAGDTGGCWRPRRDVADDSP